MNAIRSIAEFQWYWHITPFFQPKMNTKKRRFSYRLLDAMTHSHTLSSTVIWELPWMRSNMLIRPCNRSRIPKNKIGFRGIRHRIQCIWAAPLDRNRTNMKSVKTKRHHWVIQQDVHWVGAGQRIVTASSWAAAAAAARQQTTRNVLMVEQYIELEMRTATTLMNSR